MKNLNKSHLIFGILLIILMLPIISPHETDTEHEEVVLPDNLKKVQEYNNQQAQFYFKNLSFLIAFLAGILGILTPCSLAILPAFFAYSFKEKKQITKMTSIFFLGFAPVFILFGLLATFFGKTLAMFQKDYSLFVTIAGIVIILFGLMALFGKGFAGIQINKKTNKSSFGIFLFGVLFAVGFTACMGPVLVGIVLIAGILQNYFYATLLMLFYSLGLFLPLFLLAMLSDKYNFAGFINKINKKLGFSLTNIISGGLLIIMGLVFIIYGGTFITNNLGWGGFTSSIYAIQNKIIANKLMNILGGAVLIGFFYLLWRFLRKGKKEVDENGTRRKNFYM